MKAPKLLHTFLFTALLATTASAGEEVDRLLADCGKIQTVTCQIRRTKEGQLGKMTFLSRVYWTNRDQLHAEGISPIKRRTIADGQTLWQYVEGDPRGFSRPISDLTEQMTISLRMVPGTATDQLLHLKDREETLLPAQEGAARCIGIQAETQYVVLLIDEAGRLTGLRFYENPEMKTLTARYDYSDFREVLPGVWVPLSHAVRMNHDGNDFTETVRVDRFTANEPVAESLFIPSSFFDKKIDFVDTFAKIFDEQ